MTYSLNSLNAAGKAPVRGVVARFGHEFVLALSLLAWVFWLLALYSYSRQDSAWSTSGAGAGRLVANWVGRMGAWLADGSYFLLGYSVWWLVLACAAAWLASLAGWMRAGQPRSVQVRRRALFWAGLALLLLASTALEWSRLYRFEGGLPGHAWGVLGFVTGS